jgi:hypothetical protein
MPRNLNFATPDKISELPWSVCGRDIIDYRIEGDMAEMIAILGGQDTEVAL